MCWGVLSSISLSSLPLKRDTRDIYRADYGRLVVEYF